MLTASATETTCDVVRSPATQRRLTAGQVRGPLLGLQLRELCLPKGLDEADLQRLESLVLYAPAHQARRNAVRRRRRVPVGVLDPQRLLQDDDDRRRGWREQVTGFYMRASCSGWTGSARAPITPTRSRSRTAKSACCRSRSIESLGPRESRAAAAPVLVLSREIVRDHGVMMLLGSMRAEERLATFLLNLSKRFERARLLADGFPPAHDARGDRRLPGLKLETVSRLFSHFQSEA
jgi:CRP/FNR family transcriptional regulator